MRKSIIGAATIALLSTSALVSAQQPQEPRGGQPAMKEQGATPGGAGGEKGDAQRDRSAEPKDKAGDTKRSAEPKDKAGDTKRSADPKDKAGVTKQAAEPKDKASDRDRRAEPKDKAGDTKRSAEPTDKAGDTKRAAEPKDKSGDTKRSAEPKEKAGDRSKDSAQSKDGDRDGARVTLSPDQRTRVRERLSSHREARVTNVNFSINIGTRVPRDFRVQTIPNDILVIVPQYRGYRYFIVEERVVIVHPQRYEIVEVIEVDGGPRRGGPVTATLTLSPPQRTLIVQRVPSNRMRSDVNIELALGAEVPSSVELYEFPDEVLVEVPAVKAYRYVVLERRLAIVDPSSRAVVEVLDR
jgi:hypothetical protein